MLYGIASVGKRKLTANEAELSKSPNRDATHRRVQYEDSTPAIHWIAAIFSK